MIEPFEIPPERWSSWVERLLQDVSGRSVRVEVADMDIGDQELGRLLPLYGVVFEGKGDHRSLTISLSGEDGVIDHRVESPVRICVGEGSGAVIEWLAVEDQLGGKTIVYFEHLPALPIGTESSRSERDPLPRGTKAPSFDLPGTPNRRVSLEDYAGSPMVLVFYPADFTPVCADELSLFNELLPEFDSYGAKAFGISVDSIWSHIAFARERRLRLTLLSDFHPKGEVSRKYGVYRENDGISERALFVIDGQGLISWSYVSPMEINPGVDGVLGALERLTGRPPQHEYFQETVR